MYHNNDQQWYCDHGQGTTRDLYLYGPENTAVMIIPTDGVASNPFTRAGNLFTIIYIF
jgi:hypothetical protein